MRSAIQDIQGACAPLLLHAPMYLRAMLLLHYRYGAHLSKEQVAELVAPHPHTLNLINSWLEHHGVPSSSVSTSHGGGWLKLTGVPVSQANTLLGASYQLYQHAETKDRVLCTLSYSLPAVLHGHVKTVALTTYFDLPRTLQQTLRKRTGGALVKSASGELVKVLSSRNNDPVAPSFLRRLYNTEGYELDAADRDRNKLGIAAYLSGYPIQDDLAAFMRKYRSDGADATYSLVLVDDGDIPDEPDEEVSIDTQYAEAIAYRTPHTVYTTLGQGSLAIWLDYVIGLSDSDLLHTISRSYGADEQDIPEDLAIALCDLYAHLGARGVTIIFSSGDDAIGRGECKVNDGSGRVQFLPTFPASCTCGAFLRKLRYKPLTTLPCFNRSLCHQRWRHDQRTPRGCRAILLGRLLELFQASDLPGRRRVTLS